MKKRTDKAFRKQLTEEFNERIEKAKKMKSEFDKLPYSERLKIMEDNFGGFNSIGDPPILSVYPDDSQQIELFNKWKMKLFDSAFNPYMTPELSIHYSFERLKQRYEDHIRDIIKTNPSPERSINEYTQEQIRLFSERIRGADIQQQFTEFGGAWDITKKVIVNLGPFLRARACYNYLSFLENRPNKPENQYIIDEAIINKLFKKYGDEFSEEDETTWRERWIDSEETLQPIKVDEFKVNNNKHLLLTILFEAFVMMNAGHRADYIKRRWGITIIQKKLVQELAGKDKVKAHSEKENIHNIINFDNL